MQSTTTTRRYNQIRNYFKTGLTGLLFFCVSYAEGAGLCSGAMLSVEDRIANDHFHSGRILGSDHCFFDAITLYAQLKNKISNLNPKDYYLVIIFNRDYGIDTKNKIHALNARDANGSSEVWDYHVVLARNDTILDMHFENDFTPLNRHDYLAKNFSKQDHKDLRFIVVPAETAESVELSQFHFLPEHFRDTKLKKYTVEQFNAGSF